MRFFGPYRSKFTSKSFSILSTLLLASLLFACAQEMKKRNDQFSIYGRWIVEDVRILNDDDYIAEAPVPKLHDKHYLGKMITITNNRIATNLFDNDFTDGVNCIQPSFSTKEQFFSELLYDTIKDPHYPYDQPGYHHAPNPADYQLQSLNASPVKVILVKCRKGEFGNSAAYGMKPFPAWTNWLIRIDDRHVALHWYVDSLLILRRQ